MSTSTAPQSESQYSLAKILVIWVVAAVPIPILSFVIGPALAPIIGLKVEIVRWVSIIIGLMWLFVLSMIVLRRELGTLRWSVIRKHIWYQKLRDPKTGEPNGSINRTFRVVFEMSTTSNPSSSPRGTQG